MVEVIFSHGLEGTPLGSKAKIIREICKANNVKFTTIDYKDCKTANERVELLDNNIKNNSNALILVGSSMGGYVSAVCSNKYAFLGLFLIAPALYLTGYQVQKYKSKSQIINVRHGWDDDIIPVENSIKFCKIHNCNLTIDHDDHRMSKTRNELTIHFTTFLKTCMSI